MLSQACKYALRSVLYLAVNADNSNKAGVDVIAKSLEVPRHYLAKILQQLSRMGLVSSAKGPSGGFYLNDVQLQYNLLDVAKCIDGENVFSSCILGLPVCSSENPCPLHHNAQKNKDSLVAELSDHSIADMANRIQKQQIRI